MAQPDWAAIKSANAAYSAMLAAWWAALSTTLASVFAAVAVWWARKAAIQAARQAQATVEAVEWSRKAAEAASAQTVVLERQLQYSEPQPIVALTIIYEDDEEGNKHPVIGLQNFGEVVAFDVEATNLVLVIKTPKEEKRTFQFRGEPIIPQGESRVLRRYGVWLSYPNDYEWLEKLYEDAYKVLANARERSRDSAATEGELLPHQAMGFTTMTMTVSYRNARGKQFANEFLLSEDRPGIFVFTPTHSLATPTPEESAGVTDWS